MAKTCATGIQNLGFYAAKTAFYFIEEPIVHLIGRYVHCMSESFQSFNTFEVDKKYLEGPLNVNYKDRKLHPAIFIYFEDNLLLIL